LEPGREYSAEKDRILKLSYDHVIPGRVQTLKGLGIPLVIERREGYYIWDMDGHRLIDLHLNGGTFNLGHRNPEIVEVMVKAVQELDIGNHHFPSRARAELAEMLARLTPGDLTYSVFASGGSEAVDIAIKSARWATGRRKVAGLAAGYHGRSGLSGAAGDDSAARFFLSDYPEEFIKVPFNDLEAMGDAFSSHDIAAVIMETIPATSGFPIPVPGYLPGVKALCEKHGALYIADEVQTGLGRTGYLWAVEGYGVEPDILVTSKGLSGGMYPIGAAVLNRRAGGWLMENAWGHVSTFGGAEVGCKVAMKVLEISSRPEVLDNTLKMSEYLNNGFVEIMQRHPFLKEVRRSGLVMGLKFDHETGALTMSKALYDQGIWAMFSGFDLSVLQCKPGLLIDEKLCDEILERFEAAIAKI
jgi:putrescine aminotransferase